MVRIAIQFLTLVALATGRPQSEAYSTIGPSIPFTEDDSQIRLWPGDVPGERPEKVYHEKHSKGDGGRDDMMYTDVGIPSLTPFLLEGASAGVIIAPGGGYGLLAWDREGTDIARWANSIGLSAFILKYRVPEREWLGFGVAPIMDAQRALSLVRAKAADFGLTERQIGFMGFSAGAHLTAHISTSYWNRTYDRVDAIDDVSCRPDFSLLIYPWAVVGGDDGRTLLMNVTKDTPPAMISQAEDDGCGIENSLFYFLGLKTAGAPPSEVHAWPSGGSITHGYGRCTVYPKTHVSEACDWPERAARYLQTIKVVPEAHYGQPPCMVDEEAVDVLGKGRVCSAKCQSDADCSKDLPFETKASAHCSPHPLDGHCGLRCGHDKGCPQGAECMKSGLFSLTGVCAFPNSQSDQAII